MRTSVALSVLALCSACAPKGPGPAPAAAPAPAPAAAPAPNQEIRQDRQEIADSQQEVQDSKVDLRQLNDIVEDWHRGWKNQNPEVKKRADQRLQRWIRSELREANEEVQENAQEVQDSRQELRTDAPGGGE